MSRAPFEERFWAKVNKDGPVIIPDLGPCWEWQGSRSSAGYGIVVRDGKRWLTHRVARELDGNPIADGMDGCHTCDNPPCCNPAHVFEGTHEANIADYWFKRREAEAILEQRDVALRTAIDGDPRWRQLNSSAWGVKHKVDSLKHRLANAEAELEAIKTERDRYAAPASGEERSAALQRYWEFTAHAAEMRRSGNLIRFFHECQFEQAL